MHKQPKYTLLHRETTYLLMQYICTNQMAKNNKKPSANWG